MSTLSWQISYGFDGVRKKISMSSNGKIGNSQISWTRVALFMLIATVISNLFRFDVFHIQSALRQWPTWLFVPVSVLLEGSGVFIAAILAIFFLRKNRKTEISFWGTSKLYGIIMVLIPLILIPIIGVENEFEMHSSIYALIAIGSTLVYCVMEELGWRGYLQEELKELKDWKKYLIIGFLWYVWHLTFLTKASFVDNVTFFGLMVLGSWGIGQVVQSTKSVLAGACFHMIIQIMMLNQLIKNGINGNEKLLILGSTLVLWFLIVKKWEKKIRLM